jgi:hypothetical protein
MEKKRVRSLQMPRSVSAYYDYDYLHKLSPKDLAWLLEFTNRYLRASFTKGAPDDWSQEEKREAYRRKNSANRDSMYRTADLAGLLNDDPEDFYPED